MSPADVAAWARALAVASAWLALASFCALIIVGCLRGILARSTTRPSASVAYAAQHEAFARRMRDGTAPPLDS